MRAASRLQSLPAYLFAELDRKVSAKRDEGVDVISLGVGDPDMPTPRHVVEALQEAAEDQGTHQYPSYFGLPALRSAIAEWYMRRFGVELDPEREVLPLIGSKEGLAHFSLAFLDPGDEALVPDPGYPVYGIGALLAGGRAVPMRLRSASGFLPQFDEVAPGPRAKLVWLNHPSNPTAAVADLELFERAVGFARRHELLLCHDAAYSEITFDGYAAPSVLQVPGAKEVAVEFGSLSKTYNMTGWRVGYVVGNGSAVAALASLKTNIDSGIFNAVQRAAVAALTGPQDHLEASRTLYQKRRDLVVGAFQEVGIPVEPPLGSIYVWIPAPRGWNGETLARELLERAGVVVQPGGGFGKEGEGYVRASLTVPDARLQEAMDRIRTQFRSAPWEAGTSGG